MTHDETRGKIDLSLSIEDIEQSNRKRGPVRY
jgi:hypothetical protein